MIDLTTIHSFLLFQMIFKTILHLLCIIISNNPPSVISCICLVTGYLVGYKE